MANNVRVKKTGPIFDQARAKGLLNQGMTAGSRKLAPRVVDAVRSKLDASLKHSKGDYQASITSKIYPNGMAVIHSTDKIPRKTWLETKKRRGVKTSGTGTYAFRKGKQLAASENKQGYYADEIARLLNG